MSNKKNFFLQNYKNFKKKQLRDVPIKKADYGVRDDRGVCVYVNEANSIHLIFFKIKQIFSMVKAIRD